MNITLIHVSSLDGKLTQGSKSNIYEWSSNEDRIFFQKTKSLHNLIVMGSGTFNGVKDNPIASLQPEKKRLRIILTSKPGVYEKFSVPGQLEFSNESPVDLVKRLELQGYEKMLLVSGSKVATSFLKKKLVNEIYLTFEPYIFGKGEPLVQSEMLNTALQLLSMKKLNNRGTILLHYKVL